ncbi:zinc finger MYM-type protein 2-like [Rhizophagus irregularis DAOM 181602=DAOM 197198]|nr:zinc finger MYM-type protein 2-like [Rhizophagus irregularis DAOM 181602=DAOM 197198]
MTHKLRLPIIVRKQNELDDVSLLQQQLGEYISTMKRNDGCEYKATSIKQAVDALNRYLMHDLQEHGFGETSGSVAINPQQILQILQHPRMNTSSPEGLLYRIFFRLSIILAMRGEEHYDLKIDQFKSDGHDDIKYYLSKRPDLSEDNFYLQPNPSWLENGIWYKTSHIGKNRLNKFMQNIGRETQIDIPIELLSNHSGRKTATQVLQDEEIPEQAIMQLTGHKSVQGVRAYKKINEEQQLNTLKTLINITDDKLSSKQNNSSSQDNSINDNVEITKSRVSLQEISLSANSLGNEIPIFQNCTFSNVSFYIQK